MLKNMLSKIDFSFILLSLYTLRILVNGASLGDSIVVLSLVSLCSIKSFLKSKELPPLDEQLKKELDQIKTTLTGLKMGQNIRGTTNNEQTKRFF